MLRVILVVLLFPGLVCYAEPSPSETRPLIQAEQIAKDDFRAHTVESFLNEIQQKKFQEALGKFSYRSTDKAEGFQALQAFVKGDERLKEFDSYRVLTCRTDAPFARVITEIKKANGTTTYVTFVLSEPEVDDENAEIEGWEIIRIEASSIFPTEQRAIITAPDQSIFEFRLHRWGYVVLDLSAGRERIKIYGGDKETTKIALDSSLKRLDPRKFSTPNGTVFTIRKLPTPVINDGNRKINSGDWELVVSGKGPEFQSLKAGNWLKASFGNNGNNTFYGVLQTPESSPISELGSESEPPVGAQYITPAQGSGLRRQLLDAIREPAEMHFGQPLVFKVNALRATDTWAFFVGAAIQPNDKPIDYKKSEQYKTDPKTTQIGLDAGVLYGGIDALLKRENGSWRTIAITYDATDIHWLDYDQRFGVPRILIQPPFP